MDGHLVLRMLVILVSWVGVVEAAMGKVVVIVVVVVLCRMVVGVLLAPAQHGDAHKADACKLELHLVRLFSSLLYKSYCFLNSEIFTHKLHDTRGRWK